jgi:hypothetical protein
LNGIQTTGPIRIDKAAHAILANTRGIHDEAVLFAANVVAPQYWIATGDKKSIRAMAKNPACAAVCAKHAGRIVCLEKIVMALISKHTFAYVHQRISPLCTCDGVMRRAFNHGFGVNESDVVKYLISELDALEADANGMLASF